MWVINRHDGTLARIDPVRNTVAGSVGIGGDPTGVAVGEGAVWVAGGEEGTVTPRRPGRAARGRADQDREQPGRDRGRRAGRCGRQRTPRSPRIAEERCAPSCRTRPGASSPWTGCTAAAYTTWGTSQLSSLAYDGLVVVPARRGCRRRDARRRRSPRARRRRATRGGPTSSRSGGGCASPTAAPSGPPTCAPRWSASCRPRAGALADQLPPFFAGIVGAPKCMRGKAQCDLAQGDRDRRAGADGHDPSQPARHRLPAQAGDVVRVRGAGRQRPPPLAGPDAARHRPVPRRRLGLRSEAGRSSATATSGRPPRAPSARASRTASRSGSTSSRRRSARSRPSSAAMPT